MASLYKKTGSPYYWMRFSHKGKRYQESTKKKREDYAKTVMDARINEVKGSGSYNDLFNRLIDQLKDLKPNKREEVIHQFTDRLRSLKGQRMAIADAFPYYLNAPKKRAQGASTIKHHATTWKLFTDWIEKQDREYVWLHDVDELTADEFMNQYIWASGLTERTFNSYRRLYAAIFKSCSKQGGLDSNPFAEIENRGGKIVSKKPLTAEQLNEVINRAEGELRTLFLIGMYTGLRLGDASLLSWDEVDLKAGVITVEPRKTRSLNKDPLKIPIHSALSVAIHNSSKDGKYVLPGIAADYKRHAHYVSVQVQKVFEDMGLETTTTREGGRGKRLVSLYGFHSLRHSFVSLCHANNMPQVNVMELVGHTSPAVHNIYSHGDMKVLQAGISGIPDMTTRRDEQPHAVDGK